nr:response regulator [Flavobacterium sp. ASV13]
MYGDDEAVFTRNISYALKNEGYSVLTKDCGLKLLEAYPVYQPDICVVNITLPPACGYTTAGELEKLDKKVPIIYLSKTDFEERDIVLFKKHGNEYLKKPFAIKDLLACFETVSSPVKTKTWNWNRNNDILSFGKCHLSMITRKLKTSNGIYLLREKEAALLGLLALHKKELLPLGEILIKIWGEQTFKSTRTMNVYMTFIRKLLKDEKGVAIKNIKGIGYKLIC